VYALLLAGLLTGGALANVRAHKEAGVATKSFGRYLHRAYSSFHGYWTCPAGQLYGSRIYCEAEFRQGHVWYRATATAHVGRRPVSISNLSELFWFRRWSPYGGRVIRGFHTPGIASVNTKYEDWAFVAAGAHYDWQKHRRSAVVDGYDGQGLGLRRFYDFHCRIRRRLIRCTNHFGDSMRYRPLG
jgi:hypothetical protein